MTLESAIKTFGHALSSINIGDKILRLSGKASLYGKTTKEVKTLSGRLHLKVQLVQIVSIENAGVQCRILMEFNSDAPKSEGIIPHPENQKIEGNYESLLAEVAKSFIERVADDEEFWDHFVSD